MKSCPMKYVQAQSPSLSRSLSLSLSQADTLTRYLFSAIGVLWLACSILFNCFSQVLKHSGFSGKFLMTSVFSTWLNLVRIYLGMFCVQGCFWEQMVSISEEKIQTGATHFFRWLYETCWRHFSYFHVEDISAYFSFNTSADGSLLLLSNLFKRTTPKSKNMFFLPVVLFSNQSINTNARAISGL